jgi:phytol kinase
MRARDAASIQPSTMIATNASFKDIRTEIVRKSLHFLIALTPSLASMNLNATKALLALGTVFFAFAEILRLNGREVFIVSRITALAARPRDSGRFVLGPVTLGLGALASLSFYPEPAAAIAIYALAFGDGIASLAGKLFGRTRIPFTGGKSLEGSFACFIAVFSATYGLTRSPGGSAAVAAFATLVEALPVKDLDNLILPLAVGSFATLVFG